MKSLLSLLFVSSICLTSCKKELEPQKSSIVAPAEETTSIANPAAVTPIQPTEVVQSTTSQNPVQTQAVQNNVTAKGMNPPHGQPNHRCDIAVGAPLNSPPGKQPQMTQPVPPQGSATIQPATPNSTTQSVSSPVVTAAGMNPPHGQDGHRCDVAVGAPLPKS